MDASGAGLPWPIIVDGLKQDHPEWFEDEDLDEDDDELDQDQDDSWGVPANSGPGRISL